MVLDHGPGISGNLREQVFDRFYRDIDAQGSGLGLAIARQIAAIHRARIILDSTDSGAGLSAMVVFKQVLNI
ncbi:MAG: sensor histidine kinase [Gammaproteobacteria bacterium]|nr:sensor histidine kinase [Gammaproteobacteria bacterium]